MTRIVFVLLAFACFAACGGNDAAAPPRIERFAFDSGGAHHIQGHGAWRIELRRGGKLTVLHQVREAVRPYGPFDLPDTQSQALWEAVEAAGLATLEVQGRAGVPDEVRYAFVIGQAAREVRVLVWQNDLPEHPALATLLKRLRMLIEAHCGVTPVF